MSLRDQLVGFLNELIAVERARQGLPAAGEGEGIGAGTGAGPGAGLVQGGVPKGSPVTLGDDAPPFIRARTFEGRRAGYAFKLGSDGVGYYIDVVPRPEAGGAASKKSKSSFF